MRKTIGKILFCLYGICLLPLVTGCWDNRDIMERSFASIAAIDRGEDGQIELALQILKPNTIRAIQQGGAEENPFMVFTSTGETIFEALRDQLKTVNRKPFLSHIEVIIIGEDLARESLRDILDFFTRHNEIKITPRILIAKGMKAQDMINAESEIETIPAQHLAGILENNTQEAQTRDMRLIDALQDLTSPQGGTVIGTLHPLIKGRITKVRDLEIEGAAVIHKDKLVEFLDADETRGFLYLKDEVKGGAIVVDNPLDPQKNISIMIKNAKGQINAQVKEGELRLAGEVTMQGNVWGQQGGGDLATQEMLDRIQQEVQREIMDNIQGVLKVAKEKAKYDFLGFGNEIAAHHPKYWEKVKDHWDQEFMDTPVEIKVDVEIKNTGVITRPIEGE